MWAYTRVSILLYVNLSPGQVVFFFFSCNFCLSATDNTEPFRDCSFPPSLTILLLCIRKTFPGGKVLHK